MEDCNGHSRQWVTRLVLGLVSLFLGLLLESLLLFHWLLYLSFHGCGLCLSFSGFLVGSLHLDLNVLELLQTLDGTEPLVANIEDL